MASDGGQRNRDALSRRSFVVLGAVAAAGALAGCSVGSGSGGAPAREAESSPEQEPVAASETSPASGEPGGSDQPGEPAQPDASGEAAEPVEYDQIETTFFAFDTVITLKASCARQTLDAAQERCAYFESIFSRTIDTSDIGRINAAQGKPVKVAPETADIVAKALAYCEESNGLFDITIGAVSTLWDFKEGVVPDADELARAVEHVDYGCVQVEGDTITLSDPEAKLDLGGIAKGYIADDLHRLFTEAGCESGIINLGGNVKTIGCRPDGRPWRVGIQDPDDAQGAVVAAVDSVGTSVVTSGLYERVFEKDGRLFWHILDPATGWPVDTDLMSATIISDASIDGDGYTKPLFMMGRDAAIAWVDAHEGIEGLVIDMDGNIVQSAGCDAELL